MARRNNIEQGVEAFRREFPGECVDQFPLCCEEPGGRVRNLDAENQLR